jgi:outer membrane beta-barrel protein
MTRKSQCPRGSALVGAILLLSAIASLGAIEARAQDGPTPAPGDTAAIDVPVPAAPELPAEPAAPVDSTVAPTPAAAVAEANPRSAVVRKVRLVSSGQNVVRSGPGNQFAIAGVYEEGAVFPVIAKSGDWYNVGLSPTETAWVHASLCKEFDDLSDLEFRPNPRLYNRTGTYVLTGYAGAYAFDRKTNSAVFGGKLGYYVFDRVQVEGGLAWTHVERPAEIVESLFGLTLEAEEFDMLSYHFLLTYEILPGRQMVPYVSAGIGSSLMLGESEPAFNYGAGTTLYLSKKTAMRWEFRSYRLHTGPEDARVTNDNVEFTLGASRLF